MKGKIVFREMDTFENELKFIVNDKGGFAPIYEYLNEEYILIPYKKAVIYDYYYDYQLKLLKSKTSYRIRYRPNASLNFKLPDMTNNIIVSRHEYSLKVDSKKIDERQLFMIDCTINTLVKKQCGIDRLSELDLTSKLMAERVSFIVKSKEQDILNNNYFIGVAFFDCVQNTISNETFYEFELEAYADIDHVYISPYIFNEFNRIGERLLSLGYKKSDNSKYERSMMQNMK